jgi:uncharacterized protein YndB with AHSA1/START domain
MPNLDAAFSALADPTRRAILARLASGERTVMELARPFEMTQPAYPAARRRHEASLPAGAGSGCRNRSVAGNAAGGPDGKLQPARQGVGRNDPQGSQEEAMTKLKLRTEGDTHVVVTRRFAAPPEAVYRAHIEPDLIQKWLLGPEGWTMPVCVNEARPGGKIRYEWSDGKGGGFHVTGEFLELVPFSRIVHVERMHLPDPTPDNHIETTFEPDGTGTLMTMRMTLPNAETRAAMLASGMEHGMEASYVRLEAMI